MIVVSESPSLRSATYFLYVMIQEYVGSANDAGYCRVTIL
jgi:hypothetical protein